MSLACRSCLLRDQKDYVSLLAVFPEFGKKSVLDLLRIVTSSEIPYSENFPCELCANCLKKLKIAYSLIVLFKNSQAVLQKSANKFTKKTIKSYNPVIQEPPVVKTEDEDYFVDSDSPERIVIVNDDGDTYEDMVQDIFGYEGDPMEKAENVGQVDQTERCTNTDKNHGKIILVTIEDVLNESLSQKTFEKLKLPPFPEKILENINISHQDEDDNSCKGEEDSKGEIFSSENEEIYEISVYDNEEKIFSEPQEETHSSNEDDMEDDALESLKTERNKDRSMNNIQIVTIEDVLNSSRKKRELPRSTKRAEDKDEKTEDVTGSLSSIEIEVSDPTTTDAERNKIILSVEDVLKVKRWKKNKLDDDDSRSLSRTELDVPNSTRKEDDNKRILSVEDVLKAKRWKKNIEYDVPGIFECDICYKTFDEFKKVRLHKYRTHNPTCIKCPICGIQSNTRSAHSSHLAQHKSKRYPCDKCDKTYMARAKMIEHVLRVHEKKHDNRYLCPECGKGFKFRNALQYHMNRHTNSKNFVCRYCGFACLVLSALKRHERVHTGERPYQCKYCSKTFAGAPEKQKHEFAHEGVFRYQCKYCDKKFIQTYNMKVHWMQHKGPYACEMCKRAFADAEILKFHYAHAHKIKDVIIEDDEEA